MKTMLKRGAGILLPVFSLPSPYGFGTFGKAAREFIDHLSAARQAYWQVLPMGPTGYGDSPYQPPSAFAGNPYFIDLDTIRDEGLITQGEIDECYWCDRPDQAKYDALYWYRYPLLRKAFARSTHKGTEAYRAFEEKNRYWLGDYALYMALKKANGDKSWTDWPEDAKFRRPEAVSRFERELEPEMDFWKFLQFKFFEQWEKVKAYAKSKNIGIIGDIPLYMGLDSADVWAHPDLFLMDEKLVPKSVAGVPPDAFSEDGQLWGNPLYNWEKIEASDFLWWRERMKMQAALYDVVRIDHFIGVVKYYSIPAGKTAKEGTYFPGPGKKLCEAIRESVGETKIIAEDLGIFCQEVYDLLEEIGWPGMKIIEFAFSGDRFNPHLPHMYSKNSVVYGGTHDNETLAGYFRQECREWWELQFICDYLGVEHQTQIPDRVFKAAYASVASMAVFQMQDVLGLGNEARINEPGRPSGNWAWRMLPGAFTKEKEEYLARLVDTFGRF